MVTQVKTETVPLTLRIAKHYDRMKALRGDRDVESPRGRARVETLRRLNAEGYFHSPVWSTVEIANENGKKYRVDGAHSTRMLIQAGPDFPEGLCVTLRHFHAATVEEATYLWEQFNQKFSTRTVMDIVANRATLVPAFQSHEVATSNILVACRGIATHFNIWDPMTRMEAIDIVTVYPEFVLFANKYLGRQMFKKAGVIAAMFATWGRSNEKALEFWDAVRDSDEGDKAQPPRRLHKYMDTMVTVSKCRGTVDLPFVQYVKCHHAWNAWRKGKSTTLAYKQGCPIPKPL